MRTRDHNWYDPILHKPVYGVQIHHEGKWKNAAIDGKLILCDTPEERASERKRFKAAVKARATQAAPAAASTKESDHG